MDPLELVSFSIKLPDNEVLSFVEKRVLELKTKTSKNEKEEKILSSNSSMAGFISNDIRIIGSTNLGNGVFFDVLPLCFDDENIYYRFICFLKQENFNVINNSFRLDIFLFLLLKFQMSLLGNPKSVDKSYSGALHVKADIIGESDDREQLSIKEFYGNNSAMCVERSLVVQNILSFFNMDASVIFGQLEANGEIEMHAFNILKYKGKSFLLDFSNCVDFANYENNKICTLPIVIKVEEGINEIAFSDTFIKNFLSLEQKGYLITNNNTLNTIKYYIPESFYKKNEGTSY